MRYNLNTVDYSHDDTCQLLARLNSMRCSIWYADENSRDDYEDKAEDMWSTLYKREQQDIQQGGICMFSELLTLADRGQLEEDAIESLQEGFLP